MVLPPRRPRRRSGNSVLKRIINSVTKRKHWMQNDGENSDKTQSSTTRTSVRVFFRIWAEDTTHSCIIHKPNGETRKLSISLNLSYDPAGREWTNGAKWTFSEPQLSRDGLDASRVAIKVMAIKVILIIVMMKKIKSMIYAVVWVSRVRNSVANCGYLLRMRFGSACDSDGVCAKNVISCNCWSMTNLREAPNGNPDFLRF